MSDSFERRLQAERLETVRKFASQIAHEIRNPLSSISLNIELLGDELQGASEEAGNLLRSVLKELDRLDGIVGEYLQFARFPKPSFTKRDINTVVREFLSGFGPARAKVELALAPSIPEVLLDEDLFRQVLDNLVRNAMDAIAKEGSVTIETARANGFAVVRVRDTGCGIPADALVKLFEPFFTTKPHGTGLGLALSQQIMFEHKGQLLAESDPATGTTFTALLPL